MLTATELQEVIRSAVATSAQASSEQVKAKLDALATAATEELMKLVSPPKD